MRTIKLEKGEKIKIVGQKDTFLIVVNLDGDIFTRGDWDREEKEVEKK